MNLDPELLAVVVCPDCHGGLRPDDQEQTLTCTACGLVYPVVDGVPVLLVDEARRPAATDPEPSTQPSTQPGTQPSTQPSTEPTREPGA